MAHRKKKTIVLLLLFLLGVVFTYTHFDEKLDIKAEAGGFSGEDKGAGYQSMEANITNQEDNNITPEFLLITSFQSGPLKMKSNLSRDIRPRENITIKLETSNKSYIPVRYQEEFLLIIRDKNSGKTYDKKLSISKPPKKSVYQNPDLETIQGQPTGWSELFKGDVRKYSINKGLKGVELSLPEDNHQGSFSYYLTQDFNLTENITIIAEYENLETAEAGFRILKENVSKASDNAVIEVELTRYTEKSSASFNETFSFRRLYESHNQTYNKGEPVQLQLFFESEQGTPNRLHWKKASIGNR